MHTIIVWDNRSDGLLIIVDICIWNLETRELLHRMGLHKVKVQSLCFSPNDQFLASLGGQDDNNVVVWDVASGKVCSSWITVYGDLCLFRRMWTLPIDVCSVLQAVCGSPTSRDHTMTVRFFNNNFNKLVTCGNYNLHVWDFDHKNRKIRPTDCQMGQIKRICQTMTIDHNDEYVYFGSLSGTHHTYITTLIACSFNVHGLAFLSACAL